MFSDENRRHIERGLVSYFSSSVLAHSRAGGKFLLIRLSHSERRCGVRKSGITPETRRLTFIVFVFTRRLGLRAVCTLEKAHPSFALLRWSFVLRRPFSFSQILREVSRADQATPSLKVNAFGVKE